MTSKTGKSSQSTKNSAKPVRFIIPSDLSAKETAALLRKIRDKHRSSKVDKK